MNGTKNSRTRNLIEYFTKIAEVSRIRLIVGYLLPLAIVLTAIFIMLPYTTSLGILIMGNAMLLFGLYHPYIMSLVSISKCIHGAWFRTIEDRFDHLLLIIIQVVLWVFGIGLIMYAINPVIGKLSFWSIIVIWLGATVYGFLSPEIQIWVHGFRPDND